MKEGVAETPTLVDWLVKSVPRGGRVGVDPHLVTPSKLGCFFFYFWDKNVEFCFFSDQYREWSKFLEKGGLFLSANNTQNLVDVVWGAERPKAPSDPVFPLQLSFAGESSTFRKK